MCECEWFVCLYGCMRERVGEGERGSTRAHTHFLFCRFLLGRLFLCHNIWNLFLDANRNAPFIKSVIFRKTFLTIAHNTIVTLRYESKLNRFTQTSRNLVNRKMVWKSYHQSLWWMNLPYAYCNTPNGVLIRYKKGIGFAALDKFGSEFVQLVSSVCSIQEENCTYISKLTLSLTPSD